jgi:hypothetical protein
MSAPHSPSSINQGALRPSNAVSQISRYFLMDDVPQEGKVLQHDILPNSVTSISIMLQYTTVWASHRLILGLSKVPHPFSLVSLCSWQYNIQSSPKTRNLFFFVFDTEGLFSCTPLTYFSSNLTLITLNNPISYHRILSFFSSVLTVLFHYTHKAVAISSHTIYRSSRIYVPMTIPTNKQTRIQISKWSMKTPEFCHTGCTKAYASIVELKVNMRNEISDLCFVILQWPSFTLTFHAQRKPQANDSPVNSDKSLSTWGKLS